MNNTSEVPVPTGFNIGLQPANNAKMKALLGEPSSRYTAECGPVRNKKLAARMVTADVGPFRVTGFDLAVKSLTTVMGEIKTQLPDIKLTSAGMLCCRLVRGSNHSVSNHSWGTAVDLKIDGVLDERGDGRVQAGLQRIASIFNKHGWYWGAYFPTEDGMHFEISHTQFIKWKTAGLLAGLP